MNQKQKLKINKIAIKIMAWMGLLPILLLFYSTIEMLFAFQTNLTLTGIAIVYFVLGQPIILVIISILILRNYLIINKKVKQ